MTTPDPRLALETLAAELDPSALASTLVTRPGRQPCLAVASRHASRLAERIYAGNGWYWWSWSERISPVTDPTAAATKIAAVLRIDCLT